MYLDLRGDWSSYVDEVPRDLVAANGVGSLESMERSKRHRHEKSQLLYSARGVINCEVDFFFFKQKTAYEI